MHPPTRETIIARFWAKVEKTDACWLWRAGLTSYGYGSVVGFNGVTRSHRLSWEINNGPIPEGACVLHRCDNRKCVNPAHLFLGTQLENIADMYAKGRGVVGSTHVRAKLTEQEVRDIRLAHAAGKQQKILAREYGVCKQVVNRIVLHKDWRHVG